MELIPSERAVLRQIRDLFLEARGRSYRISTLIARWPATHYGAYEAGYLGLLGKGLIQKSADGRSFSITSAGLKAMV